MSQLIIWDEETEVFLKDFADASNGDVIVLEQSRRIKMKNVNDVETLENVYSNLQSKNPTKYNAVIILAELGWDRKCLQNFYGVEIAKKLRKRKYKGPIIFISYFQPYVIINTGKKNIIGSPNTEFFALSESNLSDKIDKIQEQKHFLSDTQMKDVLFHFSDTKGDVREIFHKLKNEINLKINKKENVNAIKEYAKISLKTIENWTNNNREILDSLSILYEKINAITSYEGFRPILDAEESHIVNAIPKDEGENNKEDTPHVDNPKKCWEVLLLDDQEDGLQLLKEQLTIRKISYKYTSTVQEAEEIIKNDTANKIVLCIADFRLYDNTKEGWPKDTLLQKKQGYEFLEWLAMQNRFNKMIALSRMGRKFLNECFREKGLRIPIYSKDDINDISGLNIFIDDIEELGNEMFETIINLPTAKGWSKDKKEKCSENETISLKKEFFLKEYYRYHICCSGEYDNAETYINEEAERIIKQVKYNLETKDEVQKSLYQIVTLQEIGAGFKNPPEAQRNNNDWAIFKNKMIARRVAWWLYFCAGMTRTGIYSVLMHGKVDLNSRVTDNLMSSAGEFLYKIAFVEEDFPKRILIEEKLFLKRLDADPDNFDYIINECQYLVQQALDKFTSINCEILSEIPNEYKEKGKVIILNNQAAITCINKILENSTIDKNQFVKSLEGILDKIKNLSHASFDNSIISQFETFLTEIIERHNGKTQV